MSDQEVKDIVHQYLKDKLTVQIQVQSPSNLNDDSNVWVKVSIFLGEEKITEYADCS